ncbi:MAG: GxxExxY protein [Chitinophagaceae bacterium]
MRLISIKIINYLEAFQLEIGLLINFGKTN